MEVYEIKHNINLKPLTFCKYCLTVGSKKMLLTFPQLLSLRNKLKRLTYPDKLSEIIDNENFVLIFIADKKHLVYLDIPQLLGLERKISYYFKLL